MKPLESQHRVGAREARVAQHPRSLRGRIGRGRRARTRGAPRAEDRGCRGPGRKEQKKKAEPSALVGTNSLVMFLVESRYEFFSSWTFHFAELPLEDYFGNLRLHCMPKNWKMESERLRNSVDERVSATYEQNHDPEREQARKKMRRNTYRAFRGAHRTTYNKVHD